MAEFVPLEASQAVMNIFGGRTFPSARIHRSRMSTFPEGSDDGMSTQMSRILTDDTRRQILQLLVQQDQPVSVESIAQQIASVMSDSQNDWITATDKQKIKTELHHIHLPKLGDNDLVTYDASAETVAPTDHPVCNELRAENSLSGTEEGTPLVATLENHLQREVLRIVNSVRGPTSRDELARIIASREADGASIETQVSELSVKLHHIHLPKLEDAGLVTYDHAEGTISSPSSPEPKHQS